MGMLEVRAQHVRILSALSCLFTSDIEQFTEEVNALKLVDDRHLRKLMNSLEEVSKDWDKNVHPTLCTNTHSARAFGLVTAFIEERYDTAYLWIPMLSDVDKAWIFNIIECLHVYFGLI